MLTWAGDLVRCFEGGPGRGHSPGVSVRADARPGPLLPWTVIAGLVSYLCQQKTEHLINTIRQHTSTEYSADVTVCKGNTKWILASFYTKTFIVYRAETR